MALKRVARDVLPPTAMASVDECFLLKGVVPTDALGMEMWHNLQASKNHPFIWTGEDGLRISYILDTERVCKKTEKIFIIRLEREGPPWQWLYVDRFFTDKDSIIRMFEYIESLKKIAERGMCPCDDPPKRMRMTDFDGCAMCFIKK